MAKQTQQIAQRTDRKLYLGEWLARIGRKPAELARAVQITPTYVSELISRKKRHPDPDILLDISEWLGISVNALYSAPPPRAAVEAVEELTPAQMATLAHLLDVVKPKPRK